MKGLDLSAPFRQLVERRLWPLALLLLAALVAVPLLLAKDGEPPVPGGPSASAPAPKAAAASAQPIVSVADVAVSEERRRVLGSRKDPFRPAPGPKAEKTASQPAPSAPSASKPASEPKGSSGGSPAGGSAPAATPVATPAPPKKVYEVHSLTVRFGESESDELPASNLKRLTSLPSVEEPAVIYLGLMADRKTAVFLVDAKATVQGDGRCLPSADNCDTLHLKVGETAFFDVESENGGAKQYQLDVVRVARRKTTNAKALSATARGGREAIRSRLSQVGRYRYSRHSGTVRRISDRQAKAAAARASQAGE